jgi:hypothetical protein
VVKLTSTTLSFKLRIVALLETQRSGSNSVNVRRDTSDNSASLALLATDTALPTVDLSCPAFLATATNTLRSVTLKQVAAFASITQLEIIAISALEDTTETL